jgi:hypothetical protein
METRPVSPQTVWHDFKEDIQRTIKKGYTNECHKMQSRANNIEKDIKINMCSPNLDKSEAIREEIAFLTDKLNHLQRKITKDQKDNLCAQLSHHGEKPGGIWTRINKETKP